MYLLRIFSLLLPIAITSVVLAQEPSETKQTNDSQQTQNEQQDTEQQNTTQEQARESEEDSPALISDQGTFIPSEELSEDAPVSFPVDI